MGVFLRLLPSLASCHAFANVIFFQQHDATEFFEKVPRFWLAMGLSVIGFIFSFIYCMDAGLNFLGTIDFYINFVMILVGFFEAFGSAWAYDILGQFERLSPAVVWSFMVANFGAIFLGCGLWFGLPNDNKQAVWGGFVGAISWYLIGVAFTGYLLKKRLAADTEGKWTMKSLWWELYFGNIVALRDRMQTQIGRVPFVWCFLMKHIIPHLLIILFINLAQSTNDDGPLFGNYGGYETKPYQVLGILTFVFTLFVFAVGVIFPDLYAPLALPQVKEAEMELAKYKPHELEKMQEEAGVEKAADGKMADEEVEDVLAEPADVQDHGSVEEEA